MRLLRSPIGSATRGQKTLTLQALSEVTGSAPSTLSLVERGQTGPSIGTFVVISSVLGVHISDLLAVDDRAARDPVARTSEQPIYKAARAVQRRILGKNRIGGVELALNEYGPDTGSRRAAGHHAGLRVCVVLGASSRSRSMDVAYVLRRDDLISCAFLPDAPDPETRRRVSSRALGEPGMT